MARILATAYDVDPYKGSESATGWNCVFQLARFHEVHVVTRRNNRENIERYVAENGYQQSLHFHYFDLPRALRFWKRGSRGAMLYYYLWQLCLPAFVMREKLQFDVVHNVNFHADWAPSLLWAFKKPFVWGPIGHHPKIPKEFLRFYGRSAWLADRSRWAAKLWFWKVDPLLFLTKRNATLVLCVNSSVERALGLDPMRTAIHPAVGCERVGVEEDKTTESDFVVLSVGRFVPLKGFDIAVRSFAEFVGNIPPAQRNSCVLKLIGRGPAEEDLKRLARTLGVEDRVQFVPWMRRDAVLRLYRSAHVLLFPSHEGAGMVVTEALMNGLPAICFDNSGPGELVDSSCAIRIPYGEHEETIRAFAGALRRLFGNPEELAAMSVAARFRATHEFEWSAKGTLLADLYRDRIL